MKNHWILNFLISNFYIRVSVYTTYQSLLELQSLLLLKFKVCYCVFRSLAERRDREETRVNGSRKFPLRLDNPISVRIIDVIK